MDDAQLKGFASLTRSRLENSWPTPKCEPLRPYRNALLPNGIPKKLGRTAKGKVQCMIDRLVTRIDQILRSRSTITSLNGLFKWTSSNRKFPMTSMTCGQLNQHQDKSVSAMNAIINLVNGRMPNIQTWAATISKHFYMGMDFSTGLSKQLPNTLLRFQIFQDTTTNQMGIYLEIWIFLRCFKLFLADIFLINFNISSFRAEFKSSQTSILHISWTCQELNAHSLCCYPEPQWHFL